jgi:hypothetical protein
MPGRRPGCPITGQGSRQGGTGDRCQRGEHVPDDFGVAHGGAAGSHSFVPVTTKAVDDVGINSSEPLGVRPGDMRGGGVIAEGAVKDRGGFEAPDSVESLDEAVDRDRRKRRWRRSRARPPGDRVAPPATQGAGERLLHGVYGRIRVAGEHLAEPHQPAQRAGHELSELLVGHLQPPHPGRSHHYDPRRDARVVSAGVLVRRAHARVRKVRCMMKRVALNSAW